MIEKAILAALQISLGNPDALTALALVEFSLAQEPSDRSRPTLDELIDQWGQTLVDVDDVIVERLKRLLREGAEHQRTSAPGLQ